MVSPQQRLQIALVVGPARNEWNYVVYFVGGIQQVAAALRIARVDAAASTPPFLGGGDSLRLERRDALPPRSGRCSAAPRAWAWRLWQVARCCGDDAS